METAIAWAEPRFCLNKLLERSDHLMAEWYQRLNVHAPDATPGPPKRTAGVQMLGLEDPQLKTGRIYPSEGDLSLNTDVAWWVGGLESTDGGRCHISGLQSSSNSSLRHDDSSF